MYCNRSIEFQQNNIRDSLVHHIENDMTSRWDIFSEQAMHIRNRLYDMTDVDFSNPNNVLFDDVTVAQAQQLMFETASISGWCRPRRKAQLADWIHHPILLTTALIRRLTHHSIQYDTPTCYWLGIELYGDEPILGSCFGQIHPCYITVPDYFRPAGADSPHAFPRVSN